MGLMALGRPRTSHYSCYRKTISEIIVVLGHDYSKQLLSIDQLAWETGARTTYLEYLTLDPSCHGCMCSMSGKNDIQALFKALERASRSRL